MKKAIAGQGRTIRLPGYVVTALPKIRRARACLRASLGREPSPAEIAMETGIARQTVERILGADRQQVPLDYPDASTGETLANPTAETPDDEPTPAEQVEALLDRLSAREQLIITLR